MSGRRPRSSFLLQDVPNTTNRLQQSWPAALLQLLAQVTDVDVHHVAARPEVETPDGVEQLLPAEDLPGIAHEMLEEVELLGGGGDQLIGSADFAGRHVPNHVRLP